MGIKLDARHETWLKLIQKAEMEEELKEEIFADKDVAATLVKHHMLKEMLCCAGITRKIPFFDQSTKFTMLEDDVVSVRRSTGGYLYADRAELTTCDMVANNGVVHAIDRVLLPLALQPQQIPQERALPPKRFNPINRRFNPQIFNPLDIFNRRNQFSIKFD